jgi:hypothetical protein
VKKGYTYAELINQVLNDYTDAATSAEHEAARDNRRLTAPQMLAEIGRRYAALVAEFIGVLILLAMPKAAPLGFLAHSTAR